MRLPLAALACATSYLRGGAPPSSRCDAPEMSDVPSIVVGGGRIGSMLSSLGGEGDVLLRRDEPFPEAPATGPIYVTTRNDDLEGVIEKTPDARRKDLVFMQNGMLGSFLESKGLADNTQVLLYLAVAKLGEPPIDGITDLNPDGLTAATGKWADAFTARLAKGNLKCRALDGDAYTAAMLEKHVRMSWPPETLSRIARSQLTSRVSLLPDRFGYAPSC